MLVYTVAGYKDRTGTEVSNRSERQRRGAEARGRDRGQRPGTETEAETGPKTQSEFNVRFM
jgi:hypothetical protein